jgi:hypothetical protein
MNKRPTKAETREKLESKVQEFLDKGGAIVEVQQGASGLHNANYQAGSFVFGFPKQERTPVPEVMAAIDSRRHTKSAKVTYSFSKKPRKKIIYDDFGEPVREVWVTE